MKTKYVIYELVEKLKTLVQAYDTLYLEELGNEPQALFLVIEDAVCDLAKEIENIQ